MVDTVYLNEASAPSAATPTDDGVNVIVTAGAGGETSGNGGILTLTAGDAIGGGTGGQITIRAGGGGAAMGEGGPINIIAGNANANDNNGGDIAFLPGNGDGTGTDGHIVMSSLEDFANDGAAATGGVQVGALYHTAGIVKIRVT